MVEMKGKFLKLSFIAFPCKMSIDFAIELIHRAAAQYGRFYPRGVFTHPRRSISQLVRYRGFSPSELHLVLEEKLFFDFTEGIASHRTFYRLSVILFGDQRLLMFRGKHE